MAISALAFLLIGATGIALYRRSSGDLADRLASGLAPAAAAAVGLVYASYVAALPLWSWNAVRLLPSLVLLSDYPLYVGPQDGPALTIYYGPMSAVLFLPAALGRTPTEILLIGGSLNVVLLLGPLFLIVGRERKRIGTGPVVVGCILAAAAVLLQATTHYFATKPHVDAPALALALVSCALLLGRKRRRWSRLAGAATLAVLAVWAKQIELPVALAQTIWLAVVEGRRTALRYVLLLAACGAATSVLFVTLFGFEELRFNLITVMASHPWIGDGSWLLLALLEMLVGASLFGLVVLVALRARKRFEGELDTASLLRDKPWAFFVLVALLMAPVSLLGRVKVGGAVNSYHSIFFLLVAAVLVLVRLELLGPTAASRQRAKQVLYVLTAVAVLAIVPQLQSQSLTDVFDNPQEQAYRYALAHPGTAYFPWQPLSTFLAEGRLDHFDYAIYDRELAGFPASEELFRSFLPPRLEVVVFYENALEAHVMKYLPEFDHQTSLAGMPGWVAFTRGSRHDR